ncbi:dTDP-glucose 4,6-dehydratase [Candidatus Bathyarchaeota archaeon]|nr:MAG: dTDP-glucose 4,6-dehydratase [Candidatus Bathyarchaeota archaeon]
MTRLLVTGGAGFIGSNFTRRAVGQGHDVVVLDKLTYAGNKENLRDLLDAKKIRFVKGDVCDQGLVADLAAQADAVVHFAAETHVDRSILEAGNFVQTDVVGTFSVLEGCRKTNVDRVIQISTDEVYGEAEGNPCREDAPLMPKSPYAASKAGADRLAYSYFATYGLPVVISRCTNNYGPYQHPEKLIPLFVTNALEDKPLPVYGTGKNTRDWIHVDDHCAALDLLLEAKGVEGEVFNIGASEEYSVNEIGTAILNTLGKPKTLLKSVADRPGHVRRHAVETKKIRSKLGWKPSRSFTQGLTETMQWYREHEAWWKPIKAGSYRDYHSAQHHGAD